MEWLLLVVWIREHVPAGGRGGETCAHPHGLAVLPPASLPASPPCCTSTSWRRWLNKPLAAWEKPPAAGGLCRGKDAAAPEHPAIPGRHELGHSLGGRGSGSHPAAPLCRASAASLGLPSQSPNAHGGTDGQRC